MTGYIQYYSTVVLLLIGPESLSDRSIVLRYAGPPIATRVSFLLFITWRDVAFSRVFFVCLYHFRFLFVWTIEYVVRSFLPKGVKEKI